MFACVWLFVPHVLPVMNEMLHSREIDTAFHPVSEMVFLILFPWKFSPELTIICIFSAVLYISKIILWLAFSQEVYIIILHLFIIITLLWVWRTRIRDLKFCFDVYNVTRAVFKFYVFVRCLKHRTHLIHRCFSLDPCFFQNFVCKAGKSEALTSGTVVSEKKLPSYVDC